MSMSSYVSSSLRDAFFDSTRPDRPVPHQNSSVALHGTVKDYLFGRGP